MTAINITFTFHTGIRRSPFKRVRLTGSWDSSGNYSDQWKQLPMAVTQDGTGCDTFTATVALNDSFLNTTFRWGVIADTAAGQDQWAIPTEALDPNSSDAYRSFVLTPAAITQEYWFAIGRFFGAQKYALAGSATAGIRYTVWAPHAQSVSVVFAPSSAAAGGLVGYIADNGAGIDISINSIPLTRIDGGLWQAGPAASPLSGDFGALLGQPYMYRIVNEQGNITYKVDLFSRDQIGRGSINPGGQPYNGAYADLDGIISCSAIADPDLVTQSFGDTGVMKQSLISADSFWSTEFTPGRNVPQRLQDLVIYELHVGALGYPSQSAGTFADAIAYLPYLVDLGVNAVELMPVLESDRAAEWGYGTSLFFCMQTSAGGANQLKHFVRECHRKGIAVIFDVVYNHFSSADGERTEWGYDSDPNVAPENNLWNWYEGMPSDYSYREGGYLNNGSSGYAPRLWEEVVRHTFTSSAATLLDDFHIDGLRVDLTDALHQNNSLNAGGGTIASANQYGAKLMRELSRTVRLLKPTAFLVAEDYTGWTALRQPLSQGGVGFDAIWYMDFYHHLIGDGQPNPAYAGLLRHAGYGDGRSLNMDFFAGALAGTPHTVSYHESHDEAGNEDQTERTIVTAVNGAPLIDATRTYAEGRCRFAFGMAALCAGSPMIFMGEEIGAAKPFRYNDFAQYKEDLIGDRTGVGKNLCSFYKDLVGYVLVTPAARSESIDVVYIHNDNRVIGFTRTDATAKLLVLASLNDAPFSNGYIIQVGPERLPSGGWREVFNSDAAKYGGSNIGNAGAILNATDGMLEAVLPAHGFIVFTLETS